MVGSKRSPPRRTSRWRRLGLCLSPSRILRLHRRQQRLYWFGCMKRLAEHAHTCKKDPISYAAYFNGFVTLSTHYQKYGGFDQGRTTERLMKETEPC